MKTIPQILVAGMVCIIGFSCQKNNNPALTTPPVNGPTAIIPQTAINAFIKKQLMEKDRFQWQMASDTMVWSALLHGDSILSIGYQPAGFTDLNKKIHTVDINSTAWKSAREQVMQLVLEQEGTAGHSVTAKEIVAFEEKVLPVIDLKITRFSTIRALRALNLVRYAEPIGYGEVLQASTASPAGTAGNGTYSRTASSGLGCGDYAPVQGLAEPEDYVTIQPGAKQSWNYAYHKIDKAWSKSTGKDVKIMIIDTGVSPDQPALGTAFNQGASTGRTIEKKVTLPRETLFGIPIGPVETPADGCGHGTTMAGACAAPRGVSGNAAGIAYNANLVTVRAEADVVISSSRETKGVADAYVLAGNSADVKITSMSTGTPIYGSQVADAIRYAYNKGKLMFCAAGTSVNFIAGWWGVIFPANMEEVIALTGIKDNLTERCGNCHVGDKVAFVIVMEKTSSGRNVLTTGLNGNGPATVGGSSVSTANCAGIAALVWSRFPAYTREQVVDKLKRASSYYPNKNNNFGWGIPDADKATDL